MRRRRAELLTGTELISSQVNLDAAGQAIPIVQTVSLTIASKDLRTEQNTAGEFCHCHRRDTAVPGRRVAVIPRDGRIAGLFVPTLPEDGVQFRQRPDKIHPRPPEDQFLQAVEPIAGSRSRTRSKPANAVGVTRLSPGEGEQKVFFSALLDRQSLAQETSCGLVGRQRSWNRSGTFARVAGASAPGRSGWCRAGGQPGCCASGVTRGRELAVEAQWERMERWRPEHVWSHDTRNLCTRVCRNSTSSPRS